MPLSVPGFRGPENEKIIGEKNVTMLIGKEEWSGAQDVCVEVNTSFSIEKGYLAPVSSMILCFLKWD